MVNKSYMSHFHTTKSRPWIPEPKPLLTHGISKFTFLLISLQNVLSDRHVDKKHQNIFYLTIHFKVTHQSILKTNNDSNIL